MTPVFNYTIADNNVYDLEDIAIFYFGYTHEEILKAGEKDEFALANIGLDIVNSSFKGDIDDAYDEVVNQRNVKAGEYDPRPHFEKFIK